MSQYVQNLSNVDLDLSTVATSTTVLGKLFHIQLRVQITFKMAEFQPF